MGRGTLKKPAGVQDNGPRHNARGLNSRFAEAVRGARLDLGLTVHDVADKSGVSWRQIIRIEKQEQQTTLERAESICRAVGLTLKGVL